ncbi:MAG: hypothetical protein NC242_07875 [Roseburia sp.]|nr:hypothetical protein [Roseburia sp.]
MESHMYNMLTENSSLEELRKGFAELNRKMEELEKAEPEEGNAAYEAWEKECEQLAERSETIMTWIDRKMSGLL